MSFVFSPNTSIVDERNINRSSSEIIHKNGNLSDGKIGPSSSASSGHTGVDHLFESDNKQQSIDNTNHEKDTNKVIQNKNDNIRKPQINNNISSTNAKPQLRHNKPPKDIETVKLITKLGTIHINLRPDLSLPSVQYIRQIVQSSEPCSKCSFYRAEKPGILQGILQKPNIAPNTILGDCPTEYKTVKVTECPPHDPNCGCHGPIMTRGMVGWAAGRGGPDFFIDMYKRKADWWANQHTVWGEIVDQGSLDIVMKFFELESHKVGQMTMINDRVSFDIA